MHFDHIFIVTYGRSGSTLLQGVINSIPGVLVRGENNAALRPLINSWLAIRRAKGMLSSGSEDSSSPWFGVGDVDLDEYGRSLASSFKSSVLRPSSDTIACGFKEIRYYPSMCPNLDDEIEFMRRFFPRAAFIVNTRDTEDTIQSSLKAGHNIKIEQIWASDRRLRALVAKGQPDVFHVHYDNFLDNLKELEPLFNFLGAPFDHEALISVLARTHSTRSGSVKPAAI